MSILLGIDICKHTLETLFTRSCWECLQWCIVWRLLGVETLCMTIVVKFWRLLRSFIYKYLLITMYVVHYIVSEYCAHKIFTANTVYSNLIKRACNAMSYLSTQHLVHLNNQVEQLRLPPKHRNPRYSVSEIVYVTMVTWCNHGTDHGNDGNVVICLSVWFRLFLSNQRLEVVKVWEPQLVFSLCRWETY